MMCSVWIFWIQGVVAHKTNSSSSSSSSSLMEGKECAPSGGDRYFQARHSNHQAPVPSHRMRKFPVDHFLNSSKSSV